MPYSAVQPNLDVRSLFSRSWEAFRGYLWPTVGVFLIYSLVTGGGTAWDGDGGLGDLIMFVISGPLTAGVYYFAFRLVRGHAPEFGDMFEGFRVFFKAFAVFTLYWVIVVVGLVLLVVPGIYAAIALMPSMYLVLDDDLGVIDTLRKAWAMTEGERGRLFVVFLALLGVNILGLAAFLVGVLFTGAFSLLVCAAMYDELDRAYSAESITVA